MPLGIIIKGIGGFYYVSTGQGIYECKARGVFRKDGVVPLPGDRVNITIGDDVKKTGSIDEILPRTSELVRPAVANVNQVVVVIAAKFPSPDFSLLDKLLITAEKKGLSIVICINKIDLDSEGESEKIKDIYSKANYRIVLTSIKADEGLEDLKEILKDKITVFAGQSGVGKSTILNKTMDMQVMETGDISRKISRGKHTTRHAELIELEAGGYVVDTPGFSSYELSDIEYDELELYYPEFWEFIGRCRFTRCSHISEPDCVIKENLEKGLIHSDRYARYIELYNSLKQNKDFKAGNSRRK